MSVNTAGIAAIRAGLAGAVETGVERGANLIADLARQLAPFDATADHKHLNESIEVQDGESGPTSRKVVAGVDLPDIRAVAQEFGTSAMAAQPYMTPAKEQIDVAAEVASEVNKLIRGSGI
jgi:HK97 gp10 family phage protein